MPKVRGLSRSNRGRSCRFLVHLSDNLKSHKAIIPERDEQQEEINDKQLHSSISSSTLSLNEQQKQQQQQQQQQQHANIYLSLDNRRRVSFENSPGVSPQSPSPIDCLNSGCVTQTNSREYHHKVSSIHSNGAQNNDMANQRVAMSKLSRSGCLTSLVDQVTDKRTAVNSVSEDNLSNTMSDDAIQDGSVFDQKVISKDMEISVNMNRLLPSATCSGWGQFVDIIPPEPSSRRRRLGSRFSASSHEDIRYSPYGIIPRHDRLPRSCSVHDSDAPQNGDLTRTNRQNVDDAASKLRHSSSTDGISSALCKVQISGTKHE